MLKSIFLLERINSTNKLIKTQKTGTPAIFANKLNICRRQLYNILEELKIFGAQIKYCRKKETFYYENNFDIQINYSLKVIKDETC